MYPIVSNDLDQQAFYVACRRSGESHNMAEMLALQQAPGLSGVDNTFLSGTENGKQFARAPWLGKAYSDISEKLAPGSTSGAVYKSQIARFAGDPRAWVRSRADVKQRAAALGKDVDGMVTYRAPTSMKEKKPVAIAPDLVNQLMRAKIARDPSLAATPKKVKMLRRDVLERHALPSRRQYIKDD